MFHFKKNPSECKALILIGSIASIAGLPMAPLYGHSKHAVLGMMRSLSAFAPPGTSVSSIHPWFADTAILEREVRFVLQGLPWASIPRVGGAILRAATDPNRDATNGAAYLIPDDGEVFRMGNDTKGGIDILSPETYDILRERVRAQALNPVGPPTCL